MAVAAILKLTLTAIPVIIAYIRTKFSTASKSDVSVKGIPLIFTLGKSNMAARQQAQF